MKSAIILTTIISSGTRVVGFSSHRQNYAPKYVQTYYGVRSSATTFLQSATDMQQDKCSNDNKDDDNSNMWNPNARKTLAALSTIGAIETAFLTGVKIIGGEGAINSICSISGNALSGGCSDVLSSPYANIAGIPLTAFGFAAYSTVAILSILPLMSKEDESSSSDDSLNRLALLTISTGMATFSAFLMSLLVFVLKEMCPYCILSAILSLGLGTVTWFGGAAPSNQIKRAAIAGLSSVVITTLAMFGLVLSAEANYDGGFGSSTTQLSRQGGDNNPPPELTNQAPPAITQDSSDRAIKLADDLSALDSKFFGAFWCSHCYEQKQTLGKQAMAKIPYIECDKDGKNSQRGLCKEKKLPGYPTWEIAGTLHPGEQTLDELEQIVKDLLASKK